MANALYPKGKEKILTAGINFTSDTIKAAVVSSAYTYSATHEFLSDLGAAVIGDAKTLSGKSVTNGAFDADDVVFGAVASGANALGVVLYKDSGVAGASPLIAYIDDITGFPLATNGGSITVNWDNGLYRIFSL